MNLSYANDVVHNITTVHRYCCLIFNFNLKLSREMKFKKKTVWHVHY